MVGIFLLWGSAAWRQGVGGNARFLLPKRSDRWGIRSEMFCAVVVAARSFRAVFRRHPFELIVPILDNRHSSTTNPGELLCPVVGNRPRESKTTAADLTEYGAQRCHWRLDHPSSEDSSNR